LASLFSLSLAISSMAHASNLTVGPTNDGQQMFKAEGCNTMRNLTGNLGGYRVEPKLDWDHDIWICASLDLKAETMMMIFNRVAALTSDCFNIQVDEVEKVVKIQPGPKLRFVKMTTKSEAVYEVDGQVALTEPTVSEKEIQACVLDKKSLAGQTPFDQILQ
jgi:hypothetical protein